MVAEGDDLGSRWALMQDYADEVNSVGYEYRPISQNSNSFAGALQRASLTKELRFRKDFNSQLVFDPVRPSSFGLQSSERIHRSLLLGLAERYGCATTSCADLEFFSGRPDVQQRACNRRSSAGSIRSFLARFAGALWRLRTLTSAFHAGAAGLFFRPCRDPDNEYAMIDATIVRAHQHSAARKGATKPSPLARAFDENLRDRRRACNPLALSLTVQRSHLSSETLAAQ